MLAHPQPRLVHGNLVENGIRAGEIDVFEDAGGMRCSGGTAALGNLALVADEHRLPRRHVGDDLKAEHVQGDALRGHHVLPAVVAGPAAVDQGADAVRIPKADQAHTGDHGDRGIGALATPMHPGDGGEDVVGARLIDVHHLQFMGEDVEQHLRVAAGVDVAAVLTEQVRLQGLEVGQVAVVRQGDAVRGVDVHGLRLGGARRAGSGIAHMADADVADQLFNVMLLEDVLHQAVVLAQVQPHTIAGHHPSGVLATMLQHGQGVVDLLIDRISANQADDSAH